MSLLNPMCWLCMHVCVCVHVHVLTLCHFSHVWLFATPWTIAHMGPLAWDSPGKNTGVGCGALLQEIFPTQGSKLHLLYLLHRQEGSLPLAPPGKSFTETIARHWHWRPTCPPAYTMKALQRGPVAPRPRAQQDTSNLQAMGTNNFLLLPPILPNISLRLISLRHSNMESFLHWCCVVPPDSWATMERILRYFETQNRKRTVIACSGSLHAKSKGPVVQVSWNK